MLQVSVTVGVFPLRKMLTIWGRTNKWRAVETNLDIERVEYAVWQPFPMVLR